MTTKTPTPLPKDKTPAKPPPAPPPAPPRRSESVKMLEKLTQLGETLTKLIKAGERIASLEEQLSIGVVQRAEHARRGKSLEELNAVSGQRLGRAVEAIKTVIVDGQRDPNYFHGIVGQRDSMLATLSEALVELEGEATP